MVSNAPAKARAAAHATTLGPAATLARGYAVVQIKESRAGSGRVLRATADAPTGTALRIRLADGAVGAVSTGQEEFAG